MKDGEGDAGEVAAHAFELFAVELGDALGGVAKGAAAEGAQDGVAHAGVAQRVELGPNAAAHFLVVVRRAFAQIDGGRA